MNGSPVECFVCDDPTGPNRTEHVLEPCSLMLAFGTGHAVPLHRTLPVLHDLCWCRILLTSQAAAGVAWTGGASGVCEAEGYSTAW
jgi:hypothetical protein